MVVSSLWTGACRQLSAKKVMSFIGHQRHAMRDTKDTVSGYEHADVIFDLSVDLSREEAFGKSVSSFLILIDEFNSGSSTYFLNTGGLEIKYSQNTHPSAKTMNHTCRKSKVRARWILYVVGAVVPYKTTTTLE